MVLLHSSHVRMVGVQNELTLQATVKRCFLFSFSFSLLSFPQQSSCWLRTLVMHRHKAFMKSYPPANKNLSVLFLLIWHSNNWKSKVTYTKTNDKKMEPNRSHWPIPAAPSSWISIFGVSIATTQKSNWIAFSTTFFFLLSNVFT